MKKYTIIYSERVGHGHSGHGTEIRRYKNIETDNLQPFFEQYDISFIFDGWSIETMD